MPSNQVSNINIPVTVTKVSERELKEVQKKQEEQAALLRARAAGTDTLNIDVSKTSTASSGEAPSPSQSQQTPHNQLKHARHALEKSLKSADKALGLSKGSVKTQSQDLIGQVREKLSALDEAIHKLASKNGDSRELKKLQEERYQLTEALETYEAVQFEATAAESAAESSFGTGTGLDNTVPSPEFVAAWDEFSTTAKSLGVEISSSELQEGDVEALRSQVVDQVKGELKALGDQEKDLKSKLSALEEKLKAASGPEKEKLETQKKELQAQLQQTTLKIQTYKESLTKLSTITDNILRLQISKELGTEEPKTVRSQSVSGLTLKEEKKPETASRSFASTAATPASSSGRSSGTAGLRTASASGDADVGGASVGGGTDSVGAGGVSSSAQATATDFTGTSYAINAAGSNLRSEARRTDKIIKKLLAAVMSGNMEAVTHALIFLDKRASIITVGIGAQTIKAMQSYEKQMSALNNQIGKLKGNEPDYNAKLAKLNSEMNQASLSRQSISNFLRDTMNMREEIGNTTHGMISKRSQIQSTLSRWG